MDTAYQITREQGHLVLRLSEALTKPQFLENLLDYLEIEGIKQKNQMNSEQIIQVSKEVKKAAWEKIKHLVQ